MTQMTDDERFMARAIALGRTGDAAPGCSGIGCVIVLDGDVIAEAHNEVERQNDPTAHAEIISIRRAGQKLGRPRFQGATLYSTLQPCGMCSMASIWAGISRIVYGAERAQVHRMYFEDRHFDTMDFIRDAFKDDMSVTGGILAKQCAQLYYGPEDQPPLEEQGNL
jgi:tRNA(adenine34) deaminase